VLRRGAAAESLAARRTVARMVCFATRAPAGKALLTTAPVVATLTRLAVTAVADEVRVWIARAVCGLCIDSADAQRLCGADAALRDALADMALGATSDDARYWIAFAMCAVLEGNVDGAVPKWQVASVHDAAVAMATAAGSPAARRWSAARGTCQANQKSSRAADVLATPALVAALERLAAQGGPADEAEEIKRAMAQIAELKK
jgi:hypothetical protein